MLVFLELNGCELAPQITDDQVAEAMIEVAKGEWDEAALAAWLRKRVIPGRP
jgi:prophage maintenance system killer protein